jgi:hypothetical protein
MMDNGIPGERSAQYEGARRRLLNRISEVEFLAETLSDENTYATLIDAANHVRDRTHVENRAYYSESVGARHYSRWGDRLGKALEGLIAVNEESAKALTSVLNEIKEEASEGDPPAAE